MSEIKKQRKHVCYSHQCGYIMLNGQQCTRQTYTNVCFNHRNCKPLTKCLAKNCENYTGSSCGYCPCSRNIIKAYSKTVREYAKNSSDYILGGNMTMILSR